MVQSQEEKGSLGCGATPQQPGDLNQKFGGMQWFPTTIVCDVGHFRPAPFDLEFQGLFEVVLMSGRLTHVTIRVLDWIAQKTLPPEGSPAHQQTGRRGEEEAYFYLRRLGYVMMARNFRSPRRKGEIDLIGWNRDVLCFIEVKTRTTRDVKPAEAAVDRRKRHELIAVAREYLRHLPPSCQWRFDVLSVYYGEHSSPPQFELFQNVLPLA